jgi:diguanylate cyclase (GGDEF)-like protein/PAS domain S-box-containing protein
MPWLARLSATAGNRRKLWMLALAMLAIFLLDLALPHSVPLLPFYFLMVVLSASFAPPRLMVPLIVEAYGLAIAHALTLGLSPSIDFLSRMLGLSCITAAAVMLSAQRSRELEWRRRTEQILTLTFDAAALGVGLADANGRLIRVNRALCDMVGRDASSLLSLSWPGITHPDDIARERELVEEMLANHRDSYRIKKRYLRSDGSIRWMDATISCVRLPGGAVDFFIGQAIDITDQIAAQEALARSEEHFRLLSENSSDVVIQIAADGTLRWVSPSLTAMLGWNPEEWIGRPGIEFLDHRGDAQEYRANLERLGSGETVVARDRVRGKDGRWHWTETHASLFRDATGASDGFVASFRTIDEVAIEQELLRRAGTDSLTALLNREELFRQIEQLMALEQCRGQQLAVLFCDLDHLKAVNDTYGHLAGDAVLQAIAARLRSCLRESDLAARIGGDELMVVLTALQGLEEAREIAEELRRVAQDPVPTPAGEMRVTLSVGVALALPDESLDALIARADAAMYAAKQQGRNQVVTIAGSSAQP